MSTHQILLLAGGLLVMLLTAVLHRYKIVKTPERIRKLPFYSALIVAAIGIAMPPLLRWLGHI